MTIPFTKHTLANGLRLDVSYWRRRVDNAGDPNVLFGTTIIVPNGTMLRLRNSVLMMRPRYSSSTCVWISALLDAM